MRGTLERGFVNLLEDRCGERFIKSIGIDQNLLTDDAIIFVEQILDKKLKTENDFVKHLTDYNVIAFMLFSKELA